MSRTAEEVTGADTVKEYLLKNTSAKQIEKTNKALKEIGLTRVTELPEEGS